MARPFGARACPNAAPRLTPHGRKESSMRFASRHIPRAGSSVRGYFLVALGVLALGLGACEDKHIGRPCVTNAPADAGASGGQVAIISSPNLQCPSRICLQPAPEG